MDPGVSHVHASQALILMGMKRSYGSLMSSYELMGICFLLEFGEAFVNFQTLHKLEIFYRLQFRCIWRTQPCVFVD